MNKTNLPKLYKPYCLVIGAGSGGLTVAIGLAKSGKEVVLVEKGNIGGDCTNTGCVPSKSLIYASNNLQPSESLDYVRKVRQEILDEESPEVLTKEYGIKVVKGTASFIDNKTIQVKASKEDKSPLIFKPKRIVISTGSRARGFKIPGLPESKYHTNETIFELKKLPKKLAIVGTGPIGCELGQAFAKLGVEVHVLYRKYGVLSREDEASSATVMKSMQLDGVKFHWHVSDISYSNNSLKFSAGNNFDNNLVIKEEISSLDGVLVAVGRVPNIEKLNLDNTNILYSKNGIHTDDRYLTDLPNVYAIGDVIQGPNFTHVANAQGRSVILSILAKFLPQGDVVNPLPAVTFTKPEVATVGKSLLEFSKLDPRLVDKIEVPLSTNDRAKTDSLYSGHVIIWAEKLTGRIFRATVVAQNAGEMISFFTLAIKEKISLWKISGVIIPYPVFSASLKKGADIFAVQTLSRLKTDILLVSKIKLKDFFVNYGVKTGAVVFWITLVLIFKRYMIVYNLNFFDLAELLATYLRTSSYGPLLYFVFYFLRPFVLFPASILAVLAGYVFGIEYGYIYGLFAGVLSSIPFFLIGRFSKKNNDQAKGLFAPYLKPISQKPFFTVLIMRLLALPYDMVNFVCGRYGSPMGSFLAATFLANIVGTFAYVALGASIEGRLRPGEISINPKYFLFSVGVLTLSIVISKLIQKITGKKY